VATYVFPILIGFLFGWSLQKAGLSHYDKIVNVFRMKDLAVLKFMMSAMVVGAVGVYVFVDLGWVTIPDVRATYLLGNIVGGLVFGVGMSLAGLCPGTMLAGAGQGSLDYLIPGTLGFLTGASLFAHTYEKVFNKIVTVANYGNVTIFGWFDLNKWLTISVFAVFVLLLFYFLEKSKLGAGAPDDLSR